MPTAAQPSPPPPPLSPLPHSQMGLGAWVAKLGKPGRGLVKFVLHGYIHLLLIAKDTVEVDMVTLSEIIAQKNIRSGGGGRWGRAN